MAQARGVKLGNPNGVEAIRAAGKGTAGLRRAVAANAERYAEGLRPVIETLRADGVTTLRGIAEQLNRRGMKTRRGGRRQVSNVGDLVERLTHRFASS